MLLEGSADGRPELPGGSHGSREAQKEDPRPAREAEESQISQASHRAEPRFHSEELPILFPMSSPEAGSVHGLGGFRGRRFLFDLQKQYPTSRAPPKRPTSCLPCGLEGRCRSLARSVQEGL